MYVGLQQTSENGDDEDYIDKAKIQYFHNCDCDNCMKSSIDEHPDSTSSDPSSQSGCVSQSHDLDAVVCWSRE